MEFSVEKNLESPQEKSKNSVDAIIAFDMYFIFTRQFDLNYYRNISIIKVIFK